MIIAIIWVIVLSHTACLMCGKCFMCMIFPNPMTQIHHCSPLQHIRKQNLNRGSVICHGHTLKMASLSNLPKPEPSNRFFMVHQNHPYPKCAVCIISFSCAHPSCNLNIKFKFLWNGTLNTTGGLAIFFFFWKRQKGALNLMSTHTVSLCVGVFYKVSFWKVSF